MVGSTDSSRVLLDETLIASVDVGVDVFYSLIKGRVGAGCK